MRGKLDIRFGAIARPSVRLNLAGRQSHGKRFIKFGQGRQGGGEEIFSLSSIYFSQDQLALGCTDLRQIG